MPIFAITKYSSERYVGGVGIDFSASLGFGEQIVAASVSAVGGLTYGEPHITGTVVSIGLDSGQKTGAYSLGITATTSAGNVLTEKILVRVM